MGTSLVVEIIETAVATGLTGLTVLSTFHGGEERVSSKAFEEPPLALNSLPEPLVEEKK